MRLLVAPGARRMLPAMVARHRSRRILLVASARAARASDLPPVPRGVQMARFSGFTPNPTLDQVLAGAALRERFRPDLVLAVGGGSAIDTAKLVRSLGPEREAALAVLAGAAQPPGADLPPLVAVPTTAGPGAHVTRFATVYVDGAKASLDHPSVLPDHALVDPELLRTCSVRLRYACAYDAVCHAVESSWSRRATAESVALAQTALRELVRLLRGGLSRLGPEQLLALAAAATTAGRAIDLTRTTAAHAFSYRLTARFGVPHGVACLLNLRWLLDHTRERAQAAADGPLLAVLCGVEDVLDQLAPGASTDRAVRLLLAAGGFPDRLSAYGVGAPDLPDLVAAGLSSGRARNHPVPVDADSAMARLSALL
jgi:alcohol dehydrogenase